MAEIKITDLVPQETIDELADLDKKMKDLASTYTATAKELAKGLSIEVKVIGDIDKLDKLYIEKTREAAATTEQLRSVMERQRQVYANTTNTASRLLMEQERINKTQREAYTDTQSFKELLEKVNGSYEQRVKRLVELNQSIQENKDRQNALNKAYKEGKVSQDDYMTRMTKLTAAERELKQAKSDLTVHMKNEEREMQSVEGSYRNLSQRLELMKKAYKDLTEEERDSPMGKEMEMAIQNLDAHLKDVAADMGEFQRNVGNYAIAGQNGVVSTESLMAAMQQEAVTMKDVSDQTKILTEARGMLDTSDANYADTIDAINAKLAENKARLTDVSDIMNTQATSVAEAESQNQRLTEALKNVDLSSEDAKSTIEALNARIEENNKIIHENSSSSQSIKKDLKELVLEIATLSIQYQSLSEEEQKSADGQALASHISELTERAGALKDAIADTNQAISNAASDTRGFDQLGGTLQLAIDGFGLATGAAEMLGISSEDLASIQTKLQAAIAASNAMQSIQNTLQAQSAVMQGVNLVQTKLRTIAENLHTAAKGKGVIATTALTAAQWAFNAAANANPIGLLVVAIVAAISVVWGLVKAFQAFFGTSDEALQKYQDQKKALEDLCEANDKHIDRMKARGATETELLNQSLRNKQAEKNAADALFAHAKELYDEDEDEYKEALEAKKKADEDFAKSKEDGLNYLLKVIHESEEEEKKQRLGTYEYKRQLIQAELTQQKALAATLLAQEKITRQVFENLCAALDKAAQLKIDGVNAEEEKSKSPEKVGSGRSGGSGWINDVQKAIDELKKAVRAGEDGLLQLITDSLERQRQAEIISYNRRTEDLNAEYEKRRELLANNNEKLVQLELAHNRQLEGMAAEHNRKIGDLEIARIERVQKAESDYIESYLNAVEKGTAEELEWRLRELENQRNAEYLIIQKAEQDHTLTTEQANEMRANIVLKYIRLEKEAREQFADEQIQKEQDKYATEVAMADYAYNHQLNLLRAKYAEELKAAGHNQAAREKITRKHEEAVARLSEAYAQQRALSSIQMLEKVLQSEELSAEKRLEIEKKLAEAKIEYEKAVTDAVIAESQNQADSDEDNFHYRIGLARKWCQALSDMLNSINSLISQLYDNRLNKIDEEQNAFEEASDAEAEKISELVEKKVITEEEGEARKRAAAAATAKKNKELEKEKMDLKIKQAKWEKANALIQATISTSIAVLNALDTKPFWLGIAMAAVASAMGAVEIATIASQPIPAYAKGTDYHKGGPAVVGDGGRQEVITFGNRAWLTSDKPLIVDIPQGAKVFPSIDLFNQDFTPQVQMPVAESVPAQVVVNNDYTRLENRITELAYLIRQQTKMQRAMAYESNYEHFKNSRI